MLHENIKYYRKAQGLSQQELATRLNVVRQTVSKWEKGASVPDSETLIRLAAVLNVSVTALLGEHCPSEESSDTNTLQMLSDKLELLDRQFAERTERTRKLWRLALWAVMAVTALILLSQLALLVFSLVKTDIAIGSDASVGIIGGADGPTAIFVTSQTVNLPVLLLAVAALVLSIIGLQKIK